MDSHHPFWQLTLARFREQLRQPEVLFWVFAFPLLLAVALGLAFRNRPPDVIRVGVEAGPHADSVAALLGHARGFTVRVLPAGEAADQLRKGRVAIVVVPGETVVYRYDSTRTDSRMARLATDDALQRALGRQDVRAVAEQKVMERGSRYIDFLIPGLLGLNLMGTGMWGMGYAVVDARKKKLMKRLLASPMRKSHYLLSFIAARLTMLGPEVVLLIGFGMLAFLPSAAEGGPFALGLVLASTFVWTLGEILAATNVNAFIASRSPASHRSRLNSLVSLIAQSGSMLCPLASGGFVAAFGASAVWPAAAALGLAGSGLMLAIYLADRSRIKKPLGADLRPAPPPPLS